MVNPVPTNVISVFKAQARSGFSWVNVSCDTRCVQCDQKKSPKVYQSCPKMISLEKLKILTPLQKLPKNVGDLGKLIIAKGFKKLPKVQ